MTRLYSTYNITDDEANNTTTVEVTFDIDGNKIKKSSSGNGPIDAFINTIKQLDYSIDFKDYAQKSNNDNSEKSKAITYINISHNGRDIWAIGEDKNIIKSSFNGIISAINRI